MELLKRAFPGLVVAGSVIWFTYLLTTANDSIKPPERRSDPAADRYLLQASELRMDLFRRTYDDRLEILTLENRGWGYPYTEARNEAIAELADERDYLQITINDLRGAVREGPEASPEPR